MKKTLAVIAGLVFFSFSQLWGHPIPEPQGPQTDVAQWFYKIQPQFNFTSSLQNDQNPQWGWANLDQVQGGFKSKDWLFGAKAALAMRTDPLSSNEFKLPSAVWFDVKNLYFTWIPEFLHTSEMRSGFTFGRIRINDFTNSIVNHDFDGVSIFWKGAGWESRLEGGYAGFLEKRNSLLEDSTLDFLDKQPSLVLTPADWTSYNNSNQFWDAPRSIVTSLTSLHVNEEIEFSLGLVYQFDLRPLVSGDSRLSSAITTYSVSDGGPLSCFYAQTLLQVSGDFPTSVELILQKGQVLMYRSDQGQYQSTSLTAYSLGGAWGPAFFDKKLIVQGFFRLTSGDDTSRVFPLGAYLTKNDQTTHFFALVTDSLLLGAPFYSGNLEIFGLRAVWDTLKIPSALPHRLEVNFKSLYKSNLGPLLVQGTTGIDRSLYLGWASEFFSTIKPFPYTEFNLGWSLIFPNTEKGSYFEGSSISWLCRTAVSLKWEF